ncbi:MAG TPA: glycosyltransferase [Verrucomicrobiae bacterium]
MSGTTHRPLVSLCVPTYNGAAHLAACLDSLTAQTFRDFEVIITDDASTDGTPDLAREFAARDPRFVFHANPRRLGLVGNWNHGIGLARGTWIKQVFQDDYLRPACLARMLATAESTGARFLACRREFDFAPETSAETRRFYAASAAGIDDFFARRRQCPPETFARAILDCVGANFVGEPTVVMFHRQLLEECGWFNEHLIMCCDSEFWYRAGCHTPVVFVPENLAVFRVHGGSTSAANFGRRRFRMDHLDLLVVIQEFIQSPRYAVVREVARQYYGPDYLSDLLQERAWRAVQFLAQMETERQPAAAVCRQEWEQIGNLYPAIPLSARAPGRALLWRRWRRQYTPRKLAGRALRAAGLRR